MRSRVRIGMAGYSGIGRVHALGYRALPLIYPGSVPTPVLQRVCTSRRESAEAARGEAGFLEAGTSLEELVEAQDIDMIDLTLPNHLHLPLVKAALASGKPVYCEKPLAGTIEDARAIARVVNDASLPFGIVFQYRFFPAIQRAKELVDSQAIGRVYTFRAEYLHTGYQDPDRPLSWRMKKEEGGSGALGDLGSHVIDLVRYLVGEFESVQGHLETFIHERPVEKGSKEKGAVTVDDVAWLQARMHGGAVGSIEASRLATGTLDDLRIWIYGERGALHFNLMDPAFLYYYDEQRPKGSYGGRRGWQRLETVQNYPGAAAPPPRAPIGWERAHAESQYRFIRAIEAGEEPSPGIHDGLKTQLVLDAAERSAAADGLWTTVAQQ
ncbi:MAG: Gfo/Idh/MocA family protein [Spirochaetaceae bacterium]